MRRSRALVRTADEQVHDEYEYDGADRSCGKGIEKTPAEDAKLDEDPAADERADDAEDDVGDAAVTAAAREFPGEPSGDEADDNPADDALLPADDYDALLDEIEIAGKQCKHCASLGDSGKRRVRNGV